VSKVDGKERLKHGCSQLMARRCKSTKSLQMTVREGKREAGVIERKSETLT
jgi:hypothetical protein